MVARGIARAVTSRAARTATGNGGSGGGGQPSSFITAIDPGITYEETFLGADATPIGDYGFTSVSGTWAIETNSITANHTGNTLAFATKALATRPAKFAVNVYVTADARVGFLWRYQDADNHYLVRVNKSINKVQIYERVSGTATLLAEAALSADHTMFTLQVEDDGTDIVATVLDDGVSVTASDSVSFDNLYTSETDIGLYHIASSNGDVTYFTSLRGFDSTTTNLTNTPEPMFGATEYWVPPGVRHVGTHDRTYFGWISEYGVVQVRYYDHDDKVWSETVDVANIQIDISVASVDARDDHNTPNICIDDDGKVLVFYAVHDVDDLFFVKKSATAESFDFGSAVDLTDAVTADVYNYPNCYRLANGDLILFYRYLPFLSGVWKFKKSTDNGATWSTATTLADFSASNLSAYVMIRQDPNNADRIVFACHNASGSAPTRRDIYYWETRDGGATFEESDGTEITLPCAESNSELVFDSGSDPVRILGLAPLTTGARIVYGYKDEPDHEIRVSQLVAGTWTTAKVADSTVWWNGNGSSYYMAGADVNPADPNEIVVSLPVSGVFEIQRWRTADSGATWAKTQDVTSGSSQDQWRPMYLFNAKSDFDLIWVSGDYIGSEFNNQWIGYDNCRIITLANKSHVH